MTQGLLSILRDGKMLAKIVCGCEGFNVPNLAARLRDKNGQLPWPEDEPKLLKVLCDTALKFNIGCEDCLYVIGPTTEFSLSADPPPELYRKTFNDPKHNPRWECGLADYKEIVEL